MARTAAAGTITQALIDTQGDASRTPYIDITIDGTNYWSRLEYYEYHEEAYRDRATIGLNNRDGTLDAVDMDGEEFEIKPGYDSSGHGGSTTDTVALPTLWVKSHQIISVMGERIYQIYAEGQWMRLREQRVIAGVTGSANQGAPYSNTFDATRTVYGLMELILEGAMSWTLNPLPSTDASPPDNQTVDDGIINSFRPVFDINQMPFENAAALLYRLLWMTKCYLRAKNSKAWDVVYPQTSDAVDETYYSDKAHWFLEYAEKTILLIPNSIVVLCNQDPNNEWDTDAYPLITGTAQDTSTVDYTSSITKYTEIIQPFVAGNIRNQNDANARAAAILTRLKSEILAGRLVIPHDARVELYDKVNVLDART